MEIWGAHRTPSPSHRRLPGRGRLPGVGSTCGVVLTALSSPVALWPPAGAPGPGPEGPRNGCFVGTAEEGPWGDREQRLRAAQLGRCSQGPSAGVSLALGGSCLPSAVAAASSPPSWLIIQSHLVELRGDGNHRGADFTAVRLQRAGPGGRGGCGVQGGALQATPCQPHRRPLRTGSCLALLPACRAL